MTISTKDSYANKCSTMARSFLMSCKALVKIKLPEPNVTAHIFAPFHVISQKKQLQCNIW